MIHEILLLGKTKNTALTQCIEDYLTRLKHYTSVKPVYLKEKKGAKKVNQKKMEEGRLLLEAAKGSHILALDSRGKSLDSVSFSQYLVDLEMQGKKRLVYLIGGADGLSDEVIAAADMVLSLSKMTFTHDMVRLLLVEQLYRAYTIKAGERYHK